MKTRTNALFLGAAFAALLGGVITTGQNQTALAGGNGGTNNDNKVGFTDKFFLEDCTFSSTGSNRFFILEPNYQSVLTGEENKEDVELIVNVTDQTQEIDGVETRVVEEIESHDGELAEISRNYFAMCEQTNSLFYFGEDTQFYENGQPVPGGEAESWHAGVNDAKPGVFMPGIVLLGARYQEETAPDVAMDRGEIVSLSESVDTPAQTFEDVLRIKETTPLEPGDVEYKYFAAGVGIIQDGTLKLESAGFT
jgi:hypothetical protein